MKRLIALVLVLAAVGGSVAWYKHSRIVARPAYRTATITRGDLRVAISATGTIEPEEVVDVGAQVAGKIKSLGPDPQSANRTIDYGSLVEEGTVLAQIDESIYRTQVDQAFANVKRGQADLLQYKAKLHQVDRDWARAQNLVKNKAISETEFDLALANFETAKALLALAEATLLQEQAALSQAQVNLDYCTIQSPVKGVIIDRRVNVGQTVVSNLNAPSLFLIAKDLKRLQVWASVNEADIGQIHRGQHVQFTVDAYPGQTFVGEVGQIRLNATMTQNVVTYTVVVNTDNSHGKLLPYLTANLQFEIALHENVLLAPSAAFRWQPEADRAAAQHAPTSQSVTPREHAGSTPGKDHATPLTRGRVWTLEGTAPRAVDVETGLSDGLVTELVASDVREGMSVILSEVSSAGGEGTTSPFSPKLFGGGTKQP